MTTATLLIDVGGTLVRRPGGGTVTRVVAAIEAATGAPLDDEARVRTAEALQTGADAMAAARAIVEASTAPQRVGPAVARAIELASPPRELVPGAIELLDAARHATMRVLACTDTTSWEEPLPPEIAARLDGVLASCTEGAVKHRPAFWTGLVARGIVDPTRTLIVGDSRRADGTMPAQVGICSVLVGTSGVPLTTVASWIDRLGPPPPDAVAIAGGRPESWAGRRVWPVPHLRPLVERVTRRHVRLESAAATPASRALLIRRRDRAPVIAAPPGTELPEGLSWTTARALERPVRVPADLADAMEAAGVSADGLSHEARRHLFSMVREARDPAVRAERVRDALGFLGAEATGA